MAHTFNGTYSHEHLDQLAFPLGGIGAGSICLEGDGTLSRPSLRHKPDLESHPLLGAALSVRDGEGWKARMLKGRTPDWKITQWRGSTACGLPYFRQCEFEDQFPFGHLRLSDPDMPLQCQLKAWSPFIPGDEDNSSLPLVVLDYTFTNHSEQSHEALFTFVSENIMKQALENKGCCNQADAPAGDHHTDTFENGLLLRQPKGCGGSANRVGDFAIQAQESARLNPCWFRGGWFDTNTILWSQIANGEAPDLKPYAEQASSPGGSLGIPFTLAAGESKNIRLLLAWYVPGGDVRGGDGWEDIDPELAHQPWYSARFDSIEEVLGYAREELDSLERGTQAFAEQLNAVDLPTEVREAVNANLAILRSPTILRDEGGRLWGWEGVWHQHGCCHGSCTHVWNYAQSIAHLFPRLEQSLRETEHSISQDERGHQNFRTSLPIRKPDHDQYAAADGQLGGILKVHREWKLGAGDAWLGALWPAVKQSLDYCIESWDPEHTGLLVEPHHNTYDIEFWGPDGMCSSFYLGALKAAALMADALGESPDHYQALYERGRRAMETELFNGEFFIQQIRTEGLRAGSPLDAPVLVGNEQYGSEEARALLKREGPKYQYGEGCLADGVLGAWMAEVCYVGEILDPDKVRSHLLSIFRYNFRESLENHANPQRWQYGLSQEGGLLLCTWPKGGRLTLPFPYSEEVWTGIEYQVASHLAFFGERDKALEIVRAARRRYDGRIRNPYSEIECGHWYARAMSSFALLEAFGHKPDFLATSGSALASVG